MTEPASWATDIPCEIELGLVMLVIGFALGAVTFAGWQPKVGYATNTPGEPKPVGPCAICGSTCWWQRDDDAWICGVCHPGPRGQHDDATT